MNDFYATTVDWQEFTKRYEDEKIAEQLQALVAGRDHDGATELAENFLNEWMWDRAEEAGEGYPMNLGFYRLGALTRLYNEVGPALNEEMRDRFERLYVPFVGCWLTIDSHHKKVPSIRPEMMLLACAGLSVVIEPERCRQIFEGLHNAPWINWLSNVLKGQSPDDVQLMVDQTQQLIDLVGIAAQSSRGVLVVFEI